MDNSLTCTLLETVFYLTVTLLTYNVGSSRASHNNQISSGKQHISHNMVKPCNSKCSPLLKLQEIFHEENSMEHSTIF